MQHLLPRISSRPPSPPQPCIRQGELAGSHPKRMLLPPPPPPPNCICSKNAVRLHFIKLLSTKNQISFPSLSSSIPCQLKRCTTPRTMVTFWVLGCFAFLMVLRHQETNLWHPRNRMQSKSPAGTRADVSQSGQVTSVCLPSSCPKPRRQWPDSKGTCGWQALGEKHNSKIRLKPHQ